MLELKWGMAAILQFSNSTYSDAPLPIKNLNIQG